MRAPPKKKPTAKAITSGISIPKKKKDGIGKIRRSTRKHTQFVPFTGATITTPKPKPVKPKKSGKGTKTAKAVTGKKSAKKGLKVANGKISKKKAATAKPKKVKTEKKVKTPRIKNDKLKPRPEIEKLEQNPILFGKGKLGDAETIEDVTRLVYRLTYQKDAASLKKLANDWKRFPSQGFDLLYSPLDGRTPDFIALQNGDKKLYDVIHAAKKDAEKQREKRPIVELNSLLTKVSYIESYCKHRIL